MATLQTIFRAVVMIATLGIMAKAWYLYGPSIDEMKSIGTRAADVAQEAWTEYWQQPEGNALASDPRVPPTASAPAPFVPPNTPLQVIPHGSQPALPSKQGTVQFAGGMTAEAVPLSTANSSSPWPPSSTPAPIRLPSDSSAAATQDARLPAMLGQLAQFGTRDQVLAPWGSSGELTRFSCNVPWANSPAYSRHFEAVAATPLAAVEQVMAEIEAWRGEQR